MKQSAVSLVFLLLLFLPLSSENVIVNGTRGAPWLWPCQHTFTEPFQPNDSFIYWQSLNNTVLHAYVNGKEESKHQNQLFKNKTKIFPDQLPFGNFSLVIDPLTLNDNTSLEVIFVEEMNPKRLCPVTVYVAVPFQEPKIEINQKEMTATCSTKGGYPEPRVIWKSRDHLQGHERTLEPHEVRTIVISVEGKTYRISSTVSITGSSKVTCAVYNPTSNQTLSTTKDVTPPSGVRFHPAAVVVLFILALIVCFSVVLFLCYRSED
ncbi:CD276 antigen homolog [Lates japonicus]|uniref:CD276 antigen homolog n=1 Tax=Lates japonicus TaxID=270547 RepID=A0AAD3MXE0_LATJO|nr:CD276 antigen homolog [Lates japonicus]